MPTIYSTALGIKIYREKNCTILSQDLYAADVVTRLELQDSRMHSSPLPQGKILMPATIDDTFVDETYYRSIVGSAMYAMLGTRPDLAFAVGQLSRHLHAPTEDHLACGIQTIGFWNKTKTHGIKYYYDGEDTPEARAASLRILPSSDSEWAADTSDSKSTKGKLLMLSNGPVVWGSIKSKCVAKSSTAGELDAADYCLDDALWAMDLMNFLGFPQQTIQMQMDNEAAIKDIRHGNTTKRNKYFRVRVDDLHDACSKQLIEPTFTKGCELAVDAMTKSLSGPRLLKCKERMGMYIGSAKWGPVAYTSFLVPSAAGAQQLEVEVASPEAVTTCTGATGNCSSCVSSGKMNGAAAPRF